MRIFVRTSPWAIWASRAAALALPLAVIPVLMHRGRLLESQAFVLIEACAASLAGLALLFSVVALVHLWRSGDRGWAKAISGLVLSIVCLAPFAYGFVQSARLPSFADVATNGQNPPQLLSERQVSPVPAARAAQMLAAFPNAQTRRYPLESTQVFEIVDRLVLARGWDVRLRRVPPTTGNEGMINAIATSLVGWRDEVAIRVAGDADGAVVDMRSASLDSSGGDMGANGRRIEEFLLALDAEITQLMRDGAAAPAPPEDQEGPVAPIPATR